MTTDDLPARCATCGTPRETRTCADCGVAANVIDCGDYEQPARIAPSEHDGRQLCDTCCSKELDESAYPPACDGLRGGCEQCARTWVADHNDDDDLDVDELRAAFIGIYAREPDEEDEAVGLWSLVCAGAAADA